MHLYPTLICWEFVPFSGIPRRAANLSEESFLSNVKRTLGDPSDIINITDKFDTKGNETAKSDYESQITCSDYEVNIKLTYLIIRQYSLYRFSLLILSSFLFCYNVFKLQAW